MIPYTYYLCVQNIIYYKDGEIDSEWAHGENCSRAGIDNTDGFDLINTGSNMYWQNIIHVTDGIKFKDGKTLYYGNCDSGGVDDGCIGWEHNVYNYALRPEGYFEFIFRLKKKEYRLGSGSGYNFDEIVDIRKPQLVIYWANYYSSIINFADSANLSLFSIKLLPRFSYSGCGAELNYCNAYLRPAFNFIFDKGIDSLECFKDVIQVLENDEGSCKPCDKLGILDNSLRRLL